MMGNSIKREDTEVKEIVFPVRKWEDTRFLQHTSRPVWLSKSETIGVFMEHIKNFFFPRRWFFVIDPWSQTLTLNCMNEYKENIAKFANVPYLSQDLISDTVYMNYFEYPSTIVIPRFDLRNVEILNGFSKKLTAIRCPRRSNNNKRKWENIKSLEHNSLPVWLTKEQTFQFFDKHIKSELKITASKRWYLIIDPLDQVVSLMSNEQYFKPILNVPYIGYEWTSTMMKLDECQYVPGLIIPRPELQNSRVINDLSDLMDDNFNFLRDKITKDIATIVYSYLYN